MTEDKEVQSNELWSEIDSDDEQMMCTLCVCVW